MGGVGANKCNQEVALINDRIEKIIDLKAPVDRVWRAIGDAAEFGKWFGVALDGPFREGETSTGHITHPGYEHLKWTAEIVRVDPPHRFAFTWHPYAIDSYRDYSGEPQTLVEFTLLPHAGGTRLTIVESGFAAIPASRRDEAFRMNESGWAAQIDNIRAHVDD